MDAFKAGFNVQIEGICMGDGADGALNVVSELQPRPEDARTGDEIPVGSGRLSRYQIDTHAFL
jgi:hypothetical protein